MNIEASSFRNYLQEELIRRCKQNPRYSLRAFSRSLDLESSFLSKILKGSRSVTPKLVDRLGRRLALNPKQIARFKAQASRQPDIIEADPMIAYQQLAYDSFQVIADWYHYAILELITIDDFKPQPKWIAKRLGITSVQVEVALERLKKLGMLEANANGTLSQPQSFTTLGQVNTDSALKKMQRQVLEMALRALDDTPIDERDQSAVTMAIDSSLLPEAKKRIKQFRRNLCSFLQDGRNRDRVYHLSVSLYPVSIKPEGKS